MTKQEPRSLPGLARPKAAAVAGSAGSFIARKLFGVLVLMLAAVMVFGIGSKVLNGNLSAFGGGIAVGAVSGVVLNTCAAAAARRRFIKGGCRSGGWLP